GGLVLASSFVLMLLALDIETVKQGIQVDFKIVASVGAALVVLTGIGSVVFGISFLTQSFAYFNLPIFGKVEVSSVTLFEAGVSLAVVVVVVTIILSISEDV